MLAVVAAVQAQHAFLIMAHTDPQSLGRLVAQIDREDCDIFVHIDKQAYLDGLFDYDLLVRQAGRSHLEVVKTHIRGEWGGTPLVRIELLLFREALRYEQEHSRAYQHLHLLSGQDLFIKPVGQFLAHVDSHPDKSFINIQRGARAERKIIDRGCDVAAADFGSPLVGSQWASLAHAHAEFLAAAQEQIEKRFGNVAVPDECYKQVVLCNTFEDGYIEDYLRLIVWKDGYHPQHLTVSELEAAAPTQFIGRKFEGGKNDRAIEWAVLHAAPLGKDEI